MAVGSMRVGLRLTLPFSGVCSASSMRCTSFLVTFESPIARPRRKISTRIISAPARPSLALSKFPTQATTPPAPTSTPSSFFTPSLCRHRHASTSAHTSGPIPSPTAGASNPAAAAVVLDWNTFFRLRTSRRRYSLASSILASLATTTGSVAYISSSPDFADQIAKIIPTDPFVSMGIATFGATLLGWLLGPIFGNALWRLLHRARLPEFTIKERAFFDRVKKHRVNPSGASANNPVPDFYGEKVGSVQGYRRWLKDQRAFNRKRGGSYPSTV